MTAEWVIALVMAGAAVFMLYNVLELRNSLKKQGVPLFGTRIWNFIFHRGEIPWLPKGSAYDAFMLELDNVKRVQEHLFHCRAEERGDWREQLEIAERGLPELLKSRALYPAEKQGRK